MAYFLQLRPPSSTNVLAQTFPKSVGPELVRKRCRPELVRNVMSSWAQAGNRTLEPMVYTSPEPHRRPLRQVEKRHFRFRLRIKCVFGVFDRDMRQNIEKKFSKKSNGNSRPVWVSELSRFRPCSADVGRKLWEPTNL